VTNFIRHSRARRCTLRVAVEAGSATVELTDDGLPPERSAEDDVTPGSGLAGLAERVAAVGGQLEAGVITAEGQRGFRLWVSVPLREGMEQPA
jgi:two-component system sensor histidine kinase DesK